MLTPLLSDTRPVNSLAHIPQALDAPYMVSNGHGYRLEELASARVAQQPAESGFSDAKPSAEMEPEMGSILERACILQTLSPMPFDLFNEASESCFNEAYPDGDNTAEANLCLLEHATIVRSLCSPLDPSDESIAQYALNQSTDLISTAEPSFNLVEHVSMIHSMIPCKQPRNAADEDIIDLQPYRTAPIDHTILQLLPQRSMLQADASSQQPSRPIPNPPDLSLGLAKRQEKKDLVELEQFLLHLGTFTVYHNELCQFEGPCWRKLDGRQSAVAIRHLLERHHLTSHLTRREYQELYNLLVINPSIQQYQEFSRPPHLLNLLDGTLNLMTMNLQPHDPQDGFFHYLDMDYEELLSSTNGTVFEQYVQQISNGNAAVRRQLLELVALVITGVEIKHFYVLLGPSNTGKTQFGRFLEELVGRDHVASIAGVHDFANRFTTSALAGKLLGTCLDLPDTPLPTVAIGTIKQFVGDDPIKVEQKYKDSRTIYQKPLLLFAGNHPIRISNIAQEQALFNRMVVIPFQNPVAPAQMQQQLYKSLLEEAPYIVAQAIKAYRDLAARNFVVTTTRIPEEYEPQEASEDHQAVQQFVKNCCCFDPEASIATEELYAAYKLYAAEQHLNFLNKTVFSRALSNVLSQYDTICPVKRVAESSNRGYVGLTLQPYKEDNDHAIYSILHH